MYYLLKLAKYYYCKLMFYILIKYSLYVETKIKLFNWEICQMSSLHSLLISNTDCVHVSWFERLRIISWPFPSASLDGYNKSNRAIESAWSKIQKSKARVGYDSCIRPKIGDTAVPDAVRKRGARRRDNAVRVYMTSYRIPGGPLAHP